MTEEEFIKFTINGVEVQGKPGEMLIDVAQRNGFYIPKLCNHVALKPYSACRLCIVEMAKGGRSKFTASCSFPISEGIEVNTESEGVLKLRKMTLEALMAQAPDSKEIRDMAKYYGITDTRFKENEDKENRCILCGLCIRVCNERMGVYALGFSGRGASRRLDTPFGRLSDVCITCGACESVCPTDAIKLGKISKNEPKPITSEFDLGLKERSVIYTPFPQAMPLIYLIDKERCIHFAKGTCKICQKSCEKGSIDFEQEDKKLKLDAGAIIVAPGYEFVSPDTRPELSYDRLSNVITAMEFERILNASGPFGGHIKRLSNFKEPKSMAFIQCVGSRDRNKGVRYCSSACCMYSIKEAIIAKEHSPDLNISIFHMDIRAFGKEFDSYYKSAKDMGIKFVRCRVAEIQGDEYQNPIVHFTDENDEPKKEAFDMVVLSNGFARPKDADKLAGVLDIKLNKYGFCETSAFSPLQSTRLGIFAGGVFTEPKDIPDSVAGASGAAAKASVLIPPDMRMIGREKEEIIETDVSEEEPRIGVFICHCGINIGATVNVPSVAEYARTLPNVVYAEDNLYTCSYDTQRIIKEKIKEHDLNRVVVAACSPRTHEPLFQSTISEAALNPYLFEMANIRDQCSWVHQREPERATEKAKDLVRMIVAKSNLLTPLTRESLAVTPTCLVIGGGISGLTASKDVADSGFKVFLVERKKELGGNLNLVSCLLEGENPQNFLKRLVKEVREHDKIEVLTEAILENIQGYVGNFTTTFTHAGESKNLEHGTIIVATGSNPYDPSEYLYGKHKGVITQLELEKMLENKKFKTDSVVMIQCVGSRDENHEYCSRICCTQAVKNALRIKEKNPDAEIYVLFKDMRTYGFREDYYAKASDEGVKFILYNDEHKPKVKDEEGLVVEVVDPILKNILKIKPDKVVLSIGMEPRKENTDLAKMLKVPISKDGFFLEAHMKLRPLDFATDGIFLCGAAHSPKFVNECISQASGAAARACTILSKSEISAEGIVSQVDEELCFGCGICVLNCPYNAVELEEETQKAKVVSALCKGCGVCGATCPKHAIVMCHFTDQQVKAQIDAFVEEVQ
ncbi:MAG: FAD-dependent oxidoreductase [Thermoplasmata archaeon]|nr:MAG: FAD-dependent oxidoreductase [Thermoplasmata archaeon]